MKGEEQKMCHGHVELSGLFAYTIIYLYIYRFQKSPFHPLKKQRSVPCVAPHDVVAMLIDYKLAPTAADALRYSEWLEGTTAAEGKPSAKCKSQPLFMYGDDAQYTDYADKLVGVYCGCFLVFMKFCFSTCLNYYYIYIYISIYRCI